MKNNKYFSVILSALGYIFLIGYAAYMAAIGDPGPIPLWFWQTYAVVVLASFCSIAWVAAGD